MTAPGPKGVAILGSTGSIGTTTLELVSRFPEKFSVVAMAAGRNVSLLKDQIARFRPRLVSVADPSDATELRGALGDSGTEVVHGSAGLISVATAEGADVLVSALVGAVGLEPTLAAVDAGIDVGLANKESMVVAGELIGRRAAERGSLVLPIDSEHNAIFQALKGWNRDHVAKIVLTASGGPFRTHSARELETVTRAEALAHPTWDMGDKISIDSATLMNKGLEVIEARWFFDAAPNEIEVIVHPQSIIHSMVRYRDGSVVALLAIPDMTIPVGYAISYPDVLELGYLPTLDLAQIGSLTFFEPDTTRFPCLALAFAALDAGGTMPAVANAANEVAVARFLAEDIGFTDIPATIAATMRAHEPRPYRTIGDVLDADRWARRHAAEVSERRATA